MAIVGITGETSSSPIGNVSQVAQQGALVAFLDFDVQTERLVAADRRQKILGMLVVTIGAVHSFFTTAPSLS